MLWYNKIPPPRDSSVTNFVSNLFDAFFHIYNIEITAFILHVEIRAKSGINGKLVIFLSRY